MQRNCSAAFSNSPSSLGTAVLVAHGSKRGKKRVRQQHDSKNKRLKPLLRAQAGPMPSAAPLRSNRASAAVHDAASQNAGAPRRRDDPQGFGTAADEGAPRRGRGRLGRGPRRDDEDAARHALQSLGDAQLVVRRGDDADSTDVIATLRSRRARAERQRAAPARPHQRLVRRGVVPPGRYCNGPRGKTRWALARARGLECVTLEVETDNAGARRLYEKLGFRGESLRSPLAFFKYGTWAWNKDILRLDMAAGCQLVFRVP